MFQESIGGRGRVRQGGLAAEPALAFFGEDEGRELRPAGDAVAVGRVFLAADAAVMVEERPASVMPWQSGGSFLRPRFLTWRAT